MLGFICLKKIKSVTSHALEHSPVTNCRTFLDPSPSSVTYFMGGPLSKNVRHIIFLGAGILKRWPALYLCLCLTVCLSVYVSVCVSVWLCVFVSVCTGVYVSLCLSVC